MLSERNPSIDWNDAGNAFVISDLKQFTQECLPKYFKHAKFSSFRRQLHMFDLLMPITDCRYGFRKSSRTMKSRGSSTDKHEFAHPNFLRDHPELLVKITRPYGKSSEDANIPLATALGDVARIQVLEGKVSCLEKEISNLKEQNIKQQSLIKMIMSTLSISAQSEDKMTYHDFHQESPITDWALLGFNWDDLGISSKSQPSKSQMLPSPKSPFKP